MKANRSANWIVALRILLVCLALVTIAGVTVGAGRNLANQVSQLSTHQTECPQLPGVTVSDLIAAAR